MIAVAPVTPDEYVREVLPHSAPLWAGERDPETYAAEFLALTASSFGKRRFRTVGLRVDGRLVASCKRYERTLRCGERAFRAIGIGAVFTPEALRGRGYATAMLGALLDAERDGGADLAYLFSDIGAPFYERIGFVALPSRLTTYPVATLDATRIEIATLDDDDAAAMRSTFDASEDRRTWALRRTALDWEWQRLRRESREQTHAVLQLGVRRGRGLAAYVMGRRVVRADAFVIDEFAYARNADAELIEPLLRAAAGDLRKVQGWVAPPSGRSAVPRGAVRRRRDAIAMLVPLSRAFRAAWRTAADAVSTSTADPCWHTDHI